MASKAPGLTMGGDFRPEGALGVQILHDVLHHQGGVGKDLLVRGIWMRAYIASSDVHINRFYLLSLTLSRIIDKSTRLLAGSRTFAGQML